MSIYFIKEFWGHIRPIRFCCFMTSRAYPGFSNLKSLGVSFFPLKKSFSKRCPSHEVQKRRKRATPWNKRNIEVGQPQENIDEVSIDFAPTNIRNSFQVRLWESIWVSHSLQQMQNHMMRKRVFIPGDLDFLERSVGTAAPIRAKTVFPSFPSICNHQRQSPVLTLKLRIMHMRPT